MAEIVERLRDLDKKTANPPFWTTGICGEAADEIERLRAEIERLSHELVEAESALWRISPRTHTIEVQGGPCSQKPDPFEGPGETYADAYNRVNEELETWKSVFPDVAPERVLPDRSKLETRLAKLEAVAEAVLSELSRNPSELRDQVASAIRGDGSDLCDAPWEILSDDRKTWWRGDADRAIAAVKNYLITKAVLEGEKADG